MSKSDIEMEDTEKLPSELEDTEKLPSELGDNVQESQRKILVSEVESKGETLPSEAADQENSNKNGNGDEDLKKCTIPAVDKGTADSEVEDQIQPNSEGAEPEGTVDENGGQGPQKCTDAAVDESTADGEVEEKIHPSSEAVEPVCVAEPVGEPNNDKSEDVDLNHTKSNGDEQIDAVEKHTDTENEHVKQNTTNSGLKEAQLTDNGLESGDHVKVVEEKPSADIVDKMPEESNRADGDSVERVAGEESVMVTGDALNDPKEKNQLPTGAPENKEMKDAVKSNEDKTVNDEQKEQGKEMLVASPVTDRKVNMVETSAKHDSDEPATPNSVVKYSPSKDGDDGGQTVKTVYTRATLPPMAEGDDGTPEDQAAFMKELESFYHERSMDFKPPKFYGQPLNCLKLWRSVIRLGGYDRVTGHKLWRQVGESFHPPKTCTTVSWTFRIFYEKSLLEFERHKKQCGELQLPLVTPDSGVENEGNGHQGPGLVSGRARRDSATRAMQGWHVHRISDNGEVGEPVIKDKNPNNTGKREKNFKSIGSIKQKRPSEIENSMKVARTESYKQLVTSVVDVGPPADWVKINIRQTQDCFEVYALVPGLLREEVRVQSDPAGRLVITGHPEQVDNPWGITPFKKVVSLPARIDPLQTSAVVSLHGRLFVRVPFEQSTNT